MEHRPYPKIRAQAEAAAGGPWVATEKIHGANLVVATDGTEVRFGKRKAWLSPDEPFFGFQLLRPQLTAAALGLHASLAGRAHVVRLYGELFGGGYPHPLVAPVPGFSPVQTGVWYAPDIRFALFDVLVEPEDRFLAHSEVEVLARAVDLATVPVLGRGPRSQLEALPVRYPSRVAGSLGWPALADNFAEGVVLKADVTAAPAHRPVVKRKIEEFDEARFDEAAPWVADAHLSVEALIALGVRLINGPRVASARSKVGDGAPREALVDEVVLDLLVDAGAAFPRAVGALSAEAEDRVRAALVAATLAWLAKPQTHRD